METNTASEVLDLLVRDMNVGIPEGDIPFDRDSILIELRVDPEWLKVFEGVTIKWMRTSGDSPEYDPTDFSDPWVDELNPGAYLLTAGSPTPRYAVLVCSQFWFGGGRTMIYWKGRVLDI